MPADDEQLPGRLSAVLMALVGLVGLIGFGFVFGIPRMERHLRADVARHAMREQLGVAVDMEGRTAVLTGSVPTDDDRRALITRVASRWGIARVDATGVRVQGRPSTVAGEPASSTAGVSEAAARTQTALRSADLAGPRVSVPPAAGRTAPAPVTTIVIDVAAIERLRVELAAIRRTSPIVFDRSSLALLPSTKASLDRIAAVLNAAPMPIRVEAHTDASGDPERNRTLSAERADAVRTALVARGVNPSLVTAVGRGEEGPIASNFSAVGRARNRRVELVIVDPNAAT